MNKRARGARRPLTYLSTALLALASSSAMALGLGDIRVLSRPGQPLLAEIAVITADPSELENLRVGLASPVTFERVGLQRPTGLVGELQFELTRNAQGRAVVRVTSQAPVETASLSFLVEADWGQGRLVREYSALVDAPSSALAVAEPEIVAPAGALSNTIVRDEPPRVAGPSVPAAASQPTATPAAAAVSGSAAAQPAPAQVQAAEGTVTVQAGQTLSQIAGGVARGQQVSRDRAMIALLRANPEAFIRGNVNLLRQGAVLRVPDAAALASVDAEEAAAMVREHTAQWRQSRTLPQPAAVAQAASAAPATPPKAAAGTRDARLEIAPAAAASAAAAGTTTGTGDGNEGDMLANEQLRQAREDVATRDAEIEELKQRVAELETLTQQQQALVALENTELAAAQQRLAQESTPRDPGSPWYWLGVPVLLLAAAGGWLMRRRKPSPLPPLAAQDADGSALQASVAGGGGLDTVTEREPWQRLEPGFGEAAGSPSEPSQTDAVPAPEALPAWLQTGVAQPHFEIEAGHEPAVSQPDPSPASGQAAPAQDAADPVPAYAREAEQQPQFRGVFDYPAAADVDGLPGQAEPADAQPLDADAAPPARHDDDTDAPRSAGQDRLELAIAYLDLGDAQTARTLLQEVAEAGQPHLREQARELLARLD